MKKTAIFILLILIYGCGYTAVYKNTKTQDLKITDEQLTELQGLVAKINNAQMQLGQVESQKYDIIAALPALRKDLQEFQSKLEEEYGKVSINIQDGTINYAKDEPSNS